MMESNKRIGREILFSLHFPLNGFYRYNDLFQIIPVPQQAPKLESNTDGHHPILLEFKYDKSSDKSIDNLNRRKISYERTWLLNLIFIANVSIREHWVSKQWGRCNGESVSRLCTNEYVYEGFEGTAESFSDLSEYNEIELVDTSNYYGRGHNISNGIQGPNIINDLLDIVFRLEGDKYKSLMTACKFLSISDKLWNSSQSMAYLAAISAIESITKSSGLTKCRECGQPKYGLRKIFKDYLERYCPSSTITNKARSELYDLRSKIVHSGFLFESDSNPYSFPGSPSIILESKGTALKLIVQTAIVYWLLDIEGENC